MMSDTEPGPAKPAAAENVQVQEPVDVVPVAEMERKDDAHQVSAESTSDPISTLPKEPPSPPGPHPEAPSDSTKGKEKADAAAKTTDTPPALPSKESDDFLSIEPTEAAAAPTSSSTDHPICNITLLLPTGARHPYKIDERYLTKRNVTVPDLTETGKKDPFSISVYTLKELILREWREEWNDKPASPSSIRLIHFGKLLDDKEQLKKYHFSRETPNVVHMSVRPAEMMEDDEAAKGGKSTARENRRNREGGGGCCVIL